MPNEIQSRFPELYTKFLTNSCTSDEADEILGWLEDPGNDALLREELTSRFMQDESKNRDKVRSFKNQATMNQILDKLHHQIRLQEEEYVIKSGRRKELLSILAKAAAVFLVPLLAYSVFISSNSTVVRPHSLAKVVWQTIKTQTGTQTDFLLPDGSHVWLNAGSELEYPLTFAKNKREVKLSGEAFFDVKKDPQHPFIVDAGRLNVEVKGTRFNVCNYANEPHTEVVLESGSVRLFSGQYADNKTIAFIKPGERASLDKTQDKFSVSKTDVEKYVAWKDGLLIFRDDNMNEVVTKLNRKFNVDISLRDRELRDYVYTATFSDESLSQILKLLKISAPIDYAVYKPKQLSDDTFSKLKIIFMKRKNAEFEKR